VPDDPRPEPENRLAPAARWFWTLELLASGAMATVAAVIFGQIFRDHDGALHTLGVLAPWVVLGIAIILAVVVPGRRAARWRWRLDEDELDLRRGILTEVRTIVPVARIQHVDVKRTAIAQLAGVAAVVVHTAAGATEIPALTDGDAALVRDRIAGLIRTPDDGAEPAAPPPAVTGDEGLPHA
jgi:membrane protein YdbS with pleckstrin-like domain